MAGIPNAATVSKWAKRHREGRTLNGFNGRPKEMSEEDIELFVSTINNHCGGEYAMKESDALKIGNDIIIANRKKRKLDGLDYDGPCKKTIRRIMREAEVKKRIPDATTESRMKAEANIKNSIGFCAGICAIAPAIDERMFGNVDASQYGYSAELEYMV